MLKKIIPVFLSVAMFSTSVFGVPRFRVYKDNNQLVTLNDVKVIPSYLRIVPRYLKKDGNSLVFYINWWITINNTDYRGVSHMRINLSKTQICSTIVKQDRDKIPLNIVKDLEFYIYESSYKAIYNSLMCSVSKSLRSRRYSWFPLYFNKYYENKGVRTFSRIFELYNFAKSLGISPDKLSHFIDYLSVPEKVYRLF